MSRFFNRPIALILSFVGIMIGFTSKVLAQYGAPVMHFKLLGQVKSAECEKPVGGLEITLVNDANGHVSRAYTDSAGNFNFRIIEYYWEYEFTMNIADIDGIENNGQFVSKSVRFKLDETTEGVSTYYCGDKESLDPMMISVDFDGENPCQRDTIPEMIVEAPEHIIREEEIQEIMSQNEFGNEEKNSIPEKLILNAILFPNPSDGCFSVEYTLNDDTEVKVIIFTSTGQLIDKRSVQSERGKNIVHLDYAHISSQTLIIRIIAGDEKFEFRAAIVH